MQILILILLLVLPAPLVLLRTLRWRDKRMDDAVARRLEAMQPVDPPAFDPGMVADLPGPARRYFRYAIRPGTRLRRVCRISMRGRFGLGNRATPNYVPMQADQILSSPAGFVWRLRAGRFPMRITGSDGAIGTPSWSRFWVAGIVPVARAGGTADHALSAFARHVAEAVFWTPAALLPQEGVAWREVDDTTARVTVSRDALEQSVDVTVDAEGRPVKVCFLRWSDANPDRLYRFRPFGGYLSEFRDFGGFMLPTRVEAGNFFGQEDYFPFFVVDVDDITFP